MMPEQFRYPEEGWSAGKMKKVGEAMEMGAEVQRKRFGLDLKEGDACPTCGSQVTKEVIDRLKEAEVK